jgi:uncharacterized protein YbaA (DUF1428 family)
MTYIDGFVAKFPAKNLAAYKKMAMLGRKTWMKHGALQYVEAIGDDLQPQGMGKVRTFTSLAKAKPDDVVLFSFIIFKNKAHRDRVNKKVMADPAMSPAAMKDVPMPFEMKDMAYGGFKGFVEA